VIRMTGKQDEGRAACLTAGCDKGDVQRIMVFQQRGRAESKVVGIREYGRGRFLLDVVSIRDDLPPFIEDSRGFFPNEIRADLVLDYLVHPDLSHDLALTCREQGIPIVASGKKAAGKWVHTPPICCALPRQVTLGNYGRCFGAPVFEVNIRDGVIQEIIVKRGAPCGATWKAVERLKGLSLKDALIRVGLETQFFCTANPAGWDPLIGKSPVHLAADVHSQALEKALQGIPQGEAQAGGLNRRLSSGLS
jgi:thymidylate synthase